MTHLYLVSALSLCLPGLAQTRLHQVDGLAAESYSGNAVAGVGDLDQDGFDDFAVSAYGAIQKTGRVDVISGATGAALLSFEGDDLHDYFGVALSGAGDVDGDGVPDLLIGAPEVDHLGQNTGRASVYSGRNGALLLQVEGSASGMRLGVAVAAAGDVNGDGQPDLLLGARDDYGALPKRGGVLVVSGADGAVLHALEGQHPEERLGVSLAGLGDVNDDQFDDFAVGVPGLDGAGPAAGGARVYSGADGSLLWEVAGDSKEFGRALAAAGDVDGDGVQDLVLGARFSGSAGAAFVYSGVDGSLLHAFEGVSPGDGFGRSVGGAGDVNADGFDDLIIGAPAVNGVGHWSGEAAIYSGADGALLRVISGEGTGDYLGWSCAGAGDVNGDGAPDVVVGVPGADALGPWTGAAWVESVCDPIGITYCSGAIPNSTGLPGRMRALGSTAVADGWLHLSAGQLPPGQFGTFLLSQTQGFVQQPGGSQGNLCLAGTIGRFATLARQAGAAGRIGIQVDLDGIPAPPGSIQPGDSWNFQAWYRDLGPTSNFTDAVSVTFR